MIKRGTAGIFFAIAFILCAVPAMAEKVVFPGKIEFRGVINVSGRDIVRRAGIRRSGKGFAVDISVLKQVLDSSDIIGSYTIDSEKGNLVINVQEIYPLFMFFVVDKELSVPALVDDNMNVIVSGRFIETDMPIIIVTRQEFNSGRRSAEIDSLLNSLKQVKAEGMAVCSELQEIEIIGDKTLLVSLRNRRTRFIIWNSIAGFRRLERTAALFDQAGRYPDSVDLRDDSVLVK